MCGSVYIDKLFEDYIRGIYKEHGQDIGDDTSSKEDYVRYLEKHFVNKTKVCTTSLSIGYLALYRMAND